MKSKIILTCLIFISVTNACLAAPADLIITEVYPNPIGDDSTGEFIELYNPTSIDIDLKEYTIDTYAIQNFTTETDSIIKSGDFFIIHDNEIDLKVRFPHAYKRMVVESLTARGLSNTADKIELRKGDTVIDTFEYTSSLEGTSIERPIPSCSFIRNNEKLNPTTDNTSMGYFNNIFLIKNLGFNIEYYYQGEWTFSNQFNDIDEVSFRIIQDSLCGTDRSEFKFEYSGMTIQLLDTNIIQIDQSQQTQYTISLTHIPTKSEIEYNFGIYLLPSPTPTAIPSPVLTSTPIPTPTPVLTPDAPQTPAPTPIPTSFNKFTAIRINEIYPSPNTGENEWIELYNYSDQTIDIADFKLTDLAGTHIFASRTIAANGYVIIEDPDLNITLNNSGDTISLFNPSGELVSVVNYNSIAKGSSVIYFDSELLTTKATTKGYANIASTTQAEENSSNLDSEDITNTSEEKTEQTNSNHTTYTQIKISALYPNPNKGETEWVELQNYGSSTYTLTEWKLTDASSKTQLLDGIKIAAGDTYKLIGDQLKINLNNNGDTLKLQDGNNNIIDSFSYSKSTKGKIYYPANSIPEQPENSKPNSSDSQNPVTGNQKKKIKENADVIKSRSHYKYPMRYYDKADSYTRQIMEKPKDITNKQSDTTEYKIKDTGLMLFGIVGFLKTGIGKQIAGMLFNKLESLGS